MFTWIKVAIVSIVVTALVAFHLNAIEDAKVEVNNKWQTAERKKDLERKETEKTVLDNTLTLEREKNAEIKRLNIVADNLRNSLRNRPSRETIVYRDNSSPPQACTGAELSREDGEFLAGEAARAEELIKERDFYYKQYEQVRNNLHESN